ncbi:MAG: hypothetical protein EAX95_07585 [Candidatus Thorarchaeota archaeon]|nr:hypothetical protein [Candidatus Thorarchaeota archaeon]
MGLARKIGIVILIYVFLGIAWSAMRHFGIVPISPGGLEGPANILYIIFEPISLVYFMIVMALGVPVTF